MIWLVDINDNYIYIVTLDNLCLHNMINMLITAYVLIIG